MPLPVPGVTVQRVRMQAPPPPLQQLLLNLLMLGSVRLSLAPA